MKNNIILMGLFISSLLHSEPLSFSKAYELALQNSNTIKVSEYSLKADEEKIDMEISQLYPQINFSSYYKKSEYESNPTEIKTEQGLFNYTLSLKQSIYNPEIYSRINIQKSRTNYISSKLELEKEELAQNVFDAYLNVLKSKNKIELLKSYLQYNDLKVQELKKKYDLRLANKMDLLEMIVEYNSAKIDLEKEKKLYNVYNLKLKQFIGNSEYELPNIDSNRSIDNMIALMKDTIKTKNESLMLKLAKVGLEVSANELELAKDGHLPRLNFNASYALYDTDNPDIQAPYNYTRYMMVTLDIPIFSGGYVSSKVESALQQQNAAQEDLIRVEKEVKVQYSEYLALFEASAESVSMYKQALDSAKLYASAIEQGYEHGLKSITDLNDAENKLYEVKYKYVENIYEMVNSYIGLLIVTNNFDGVKILDDLLDK